jgi:hypothetical protein
MAIRQGGAISGGSRRRNQIAELNARQALLPTILANQQRKEGIEREDELNKIQQSQFSRQHGLAERRFGFEQESARKSRQAADRASEVSMGLSAATLGTNMATRYGGKSVGDVAGSIKGIFSSGPSKPYTFGGGKTGNLVSNLSVGSAVGGGLAGFGVGKMLGKKKSKVTKGLAGAGVGAALGLLGGGNSFGGMLSGGLGGALGGLFG